MTLTKEDLHAIGELLDEKLEQKLEEKLEQKLDEKLEQKLDEKLEQKLEEKLAPIKADISGLKTDMAEVKERVTKIEITQENVVLPSLRLLAEGHQGVIDRLDRLERLPDKIDDIQATVSVLKYVFKEHVH